MRPTPTVTVSVDLDDCAMMNEAVDGCDSDGGIGEDLVPFTEQLIAGDDQAPALVALGDQLEQDRRFGIIFADVAETIED